MASFSDDAGVPALVLVVNLRVSENYKCWKRNTCALLLGQALWKHASGQVPIPITQAQWDWEEAADKAKTPNDVP